MRQKFSSVFPISHRVYGSNRQSFSSRYKSTINPVVTKAEQIQKLKGQKYKGQQPKLGAGCVQHPALQKAIELVSN